MRLISCHIENFGRLHDTDITFVPGVNVVLEENGWGKSTLAVFIRVMFYGFDNDKKRDVIVNERRHFLPWQNGTYGGSVVFNADGKQYRMERTFGSAKSKDTWKLFDEATHLPSGDFSANTGEELFGIDAASFERTIYTGQQNCETSVTSEIGARIGRVSDQTADMGNFETVQASLAKELNRLTPERKTGRISQLERETAALRQEAAMQKSARKELDDLQEQTAGLERDRERVMKRQKRNAARLQELGAAKDLQTEAEQYRNLLEEEREAAARLEEERRSFGGHTLSSGDFAEAARLEKALADAEKRRRAADEKLRRLMLENEEAGGDERTKKGKGSALLRPLLICLAVLVIEAVVLPLEGHPAAGVLCACGAAAAGIAAFLIQKKRGAEKRAPEPSVRYRELRGELDACESETADVEREIADFLTARGMDAGDDPAARLREMESRAAAAMELRNAYGMRKERRLAFERDHDMKKIADAAKMETDSMKELAAEQEQLQYEINENGEALRAARNLTDRALERLEAARSAGRELEIKTRELENLRHRYEVIRRTKAFLEQAKANFSARYMDPIKRSFDKYYEMLSGGDEKQYELDADLNLSLKEQGGTHDTGFLSTGYRDMVGLCRRMAMTDAMYEKEKPFLIFDDPFVNLDDARLAGALDFLRRIAKDYQVIYFTCSRSRVPSHSSAERIVPAELLL